MPQARCSACGSRRGHALCCWAQVRWVGAASLPVVLRGQRGLVACRFSLPLCPRLPHLSATADTELVLALDPLADKQEAAAVCSRLGMWLNARHDQLFSL